MDRRTVLRAGAGAGLAAGLWAPVGQAAAARKDADWAGLKKLLGGRLFRPGDRQFWPLNLPANPFYADRVPGGIAYPQTPDDVATAVNWAGENGVKVVPRSGGHNYAGYSTTDGGLLVHLGGMRDVKVNGTTLTVGAGARNADVYAALKDTDLLLPGGRCPDVGVSGLVLGGGIGLATRNLGLTCDSLTGTTAVLADGYTATCHENSNSELFWACRGGAGGNFGINTSYTFRLHRVQGVVTYDLSWDWKDAKSALKALAGLIAESRHRKTLACQFGLRTSGNARVYAQGLYFGPQETLMSLIGRLPRPKSRAVKRAGVWEGMSRFYETSSGDPYASGSIVAKQNLATPVIEQLVDAFSGWKSVTPASRATVSFFAMGGADTALRPTDTAYVHRDATFIVDLATYWSDGDPDQAAAGNKQALQRLYGMLSAPLGTGAYQNFPDPDLQGWQAAYYGRNYAGLQRVKRTVDPDRLFTYPQGIVPAP
ncbi:FAD-binding oxidoreductase [Streptomyces sp. XH2]|uniref:FAD-binding oxidoreductase n=1 Tax=Streptomyces sp. XH2 TaxID=3412483 RepID=UPI003C7C7454